MLSKEELFKVNNFKQREMEKFEKELDAELRKTTDINNERVKVGLWGSYSRDVIETVLSKYVEYGNYLKYEYKEGFDRCSFVSVTLYY